MKTTKILALLLLSATSLWASDRSYRTINLASYCNVGIADSLIPGGSIDSRAFASVPFDISGIIQLSSQKSVLYHRALPERVAGIKVDAACQNLHLLHAAGANGVTDTTIATLTINYADGDKRDIAIVYGKHVCDWLDNSGEDLDKNTTVAWTGANRLTKAMGTDLRLYKTTFANPKPGATIASVDFVSAKKNAAPLLLGLTLE